MLRIFKNPQFPFMEYRKFLIGFSITISLLGVVLFFVRGGFNYGIDFAGGTQVAAKFRDPMDISNLRSILEGAGFKDAAIQYFDDPKNNEFLIRVQNIEGKEEQTVAHLHEVLRGKLNAPAAGSDLNLIGTQSIAEILEGASGADAESSRAVAEAVAALKKKDGVLKAHADLKGVAGMTPAMFDQLKQKTTVGPYALLSVETVGPKVGKDPRSKATLAVVFSLLAMLVYIWLRFRHFAWGMGATIATLHDIVMALTFVLIWNRPIDLTGIAALLTLVGYSVNDTVIVFDRIRENMRLRKPGTMLEIMNRSINETLSRTVITSGLTWLVVACLFFFGGDVINNFAFIMFWGILIGTYSSIFIATPFAWLFVHTRFDKTAKKK